MKIEVFSLSLFTKLFGNQLKIMLINGLIDRQLILASPRLLLPSDLQVWHRQGLG